MDGQQQEQEEQQQQLMMMMMTPTRCTLKQMLEYSCSAITSPRGVLDFDHSSVYADTISICTRFISSDEEDGRTAELDLSITQQQQQRCFRWRRKKQQQQQQQQQFSEQKQQSSMFRRLATFPQSKYSHKFINKCNSMIGSSSFKFNRVSPSTESSDSSSEPVSHGEISSSSNKKGGWKCFSYSDIAVATNYFDSGNLIGKGGYSDVYKGCLSDGQMVAVKRMILHHEREEQHQGTSFLTELGILGHVNHPNTASLLGFCIDKGLYLIFHFFPHGSLASVLHGPKMRVMEWNVRFKVALGTAQGLHYLHTNCKRRIIHRDIKASNILLGLDFEPQITDFGLAKWLPSEWTHHTVPVEGTFGYLAPEYFMHGIVDEKTDVFAFGVLLLELITGHRPIDSSQKSLVIRVTPLLESGEWQQLVDSRLGAMYNANELQRTILAARLCVRHSSILRPSMTDVVKILTDEKMPSDPSTAVSCCEDELIVHQRDMSSYTALAFDNST